MNPYNHKFSQKITTDADGVAVDRSFIAHIQINGTDAVSADSSGVLASAALTSIAQSITDNITSPGTPRNISIVGNAAGIVGDVIVTGTNYADAIISETIALNGSATVEGSKAFKTVTQIDLPIETNVGSDTVSAGWGDTLGLPYTLTHDTILATYLDSIKEVTAPTVKVSIEIESNTIKLNSALDGTAVDIYLIV